MSNGTLTPQRPAGGDSVQEQLPFDPRTLLLGLWRRRWVLAFFMIISAVVGFYAGTKYGERQYLAHTTLLYRPEDRLKAVPLQTQKQEVMSAENLDETIARLSLGCERRTLQRAVEVEIVKEDRDDTDVLAIHAQWSDAEKAAAIANTLRDVFLVNQERLQKRLRFEDRFKTLDKEYRETAQRRREVEKQVTQVIAEIDKLKGLIKEAGATMPAETLPELNIRIGRIREAISADKQARSNLADLDEKKLAWERARKLFAEGLVSKIDVERAQAEYDKVKALVEDTDQIKGWKEAMEQLDKAVIPTIRGGAKDGTSPSGLAMQNVMTKAFEISLEKIALEERVAYLEKTREEAKNSLDALLAAQEKRRTGDKTGVPLEQPTPGGTDFYLSSPAGVPRDPVSSSRLLIAASVALGGTWIGFVLILAAELLDPTIRSEAELSLKLNQPVIGTLPSVRPPEAVYPDTEGSALFEPFKVIAWQVRRAVPKRGARILVVSARAGEGRTAVAANLASCFGRQDERVLLVDTNVRPGESPFTCARLISEVDKPLKGLGEYLSFKVEHLEDVLWPTVLPGVECLPRVEEAVIPDLIASNRMRETLDDLSKRYSIILFDAPPIFPFVDADVVAQYCDGIVFVVRSRTCRRATVRKALERMKATGVPIVGAVLNDVASTYLEV